MSTILYQSTINQVGKFAQETVNEGMIILFKQGAPADLADYCFVHSHDQLKKPLEVGQIVKLGSHEYKITAVGEVASTNLRELGHVTLHFDGAITAALPGEIHLDNQIPEALSVGDQIIILSL